MAGACVPQTSPAAERPRGPRMARFDPNRRITQRSERIVNPRACAEREQSTSSEPPRKRARVSQGQARISTWSQSDRIRYWSEEGTWPSEGEEAAMKSLREMHLLDTLARRRSSNTRKRSSSTLNSDSITADQKPTGSEKNNYTDEQVIRDLKDFGSFITDHKEGITPESKMLCQELLSTAQKMPEGTLFSDELFPGLCERVKGQNEATVVRWILPHLVPSPTIRVLRGAEHLKILNDTINASWLNAKECCDRRPQPDYSIGINREAFGPERLLKLRPFIANRLKDESLLNATCDVCFPFLTTEVKCGAIGLDVADRQNALSQTIGLRGLVALFRLVHREQELHRKVLGFSISHDNQAVRIYGHYPFINGEDTTYHRYVISMFSILPTTEGDHRWKTTTFVQNVQDLWAVKHFTMICSAIDELKFEAESLAIAPPSEQSTRTSRRSGLSQQLKNSENEDGTQPGITPTTSDVSTTTGTGKKKKNNAGTPKR